MELHTCDFPGKYSRNEESSQEFFSRGKKPKKKKRKKQKKKRKEKRNNIAKESNVWLPWRVSWPWANRRETFHCGKRWPWVRLLQTRWFWVGRCWSASGRCPTGRVLRISSWCLWSYTPRNPTSGRTKTFASFSEIISNIVERSWLVDKSIIKFLSNANQTASGFISIKFYYSFFPIYLHVLWKEGRNKWRKREIRRRLTNLWQRVCLWCK